MKQETINLYKKIFLEVYNIMMTILINQRSLENTIYEKFNAIMELFLDCPFDDQF